LVILSENQEGLDKVDECLNNQIAPEIT